MLTRFKLLFARRNLNSALVHEKMLRDSLEHMHRITLPRLENRVENLEFEMLLDNHLKHPLEGDDK